MKINEFSAAFNERMAKKKILPRAEIATTTPVTTPPTVTEQVPEITEAEKQPIIYGLNAEPGHEIHRIRDTNPRLWNKINNWD